MIIRLGQVDIPVVIVIELLVQTPDRFHPEVIMVRDAVQIVGTAGPVGRAAPVGAEFVVNGLRHGLAQHRVGIARLQHPIATATATS